MLFLWYIWHKYGCFIDSNTILWYILSIRYFTNHSENAKGDMLLTIEEMKKRKKELGFTNQMIADQSGVPFSTVQKIFSGKTAAPRRETIRALEGLLKPELTYDLPNIVETAGTASLNRPAVPYQTRKLYTLKDYLALPEDQRVELIDGVFYDMAAPTTIHQSIGGFIHKKFLDHVLEHKGPCYPFIAPVDVQLDSDDKTVVQPDVMIVCDRSKYKKGRIFGAPDLVIEILSPSTRKKDMQLKLHKYGAAGVREYWIIDPKTKRVIQYDLENLDFPKLYTFEDTVPVLIWDCACQIDFRELYDAVSFLWEYED